MEKTFVVTEKAEVMNFGNANEVRNFTNGHLELINIGGATVGKAVFEPDWRWSESVKPIAKTDSCELAHFHYQVSGILRVLMDDGTELESKAGEVSLIPPGHDAWVVGNESVILIDFQGMVDYAKAH